MTKDEIRSIASLARIHLEEKELENLANCKNWMSKTFRRPPMYCL